MIKAEQIKIQGKHRKIGTERTQTGHEHAHRHEHDANCSHGHSHRHPIRNAVLRRISNPTMKAVTTAVFRGSSLLLCPGDDIAAATLVALNGDDHHTEMTATLPQQPSLQQEIVVLDSKKRRKLLKHDLGTIDDFVEDTKKHGKHSSDVTKALSTYAGRHRKVETVNRERIAQSLKARSTRRRQLAVATSIVAAVGAGAIGIDKFTNGNESSNDSHHSTLFAGETPNQRKFTFEIPRQPQEFTIAPSRVVFEQVQRSGTQWAMVKEEIIEAGYQPTAQSINVLSDITAYQNRDTIPNPDTLHFGQTIALPNEAAIDLVYATLENPSSNPSFAHDLYELNTTKAMPKKEKLIQKDSLFKRVTSYISKHMQR